MHATVLLGWTGRALVDQGRWQEAVTELEKRLSLAQRITKDKRVGRGAAGC